MKFLNSLKNLLSRDSSDAESTRATAHADDTTANSENTTSDTATACDTDDVRQTEATAEEKAEATTKPAIALSDDLLDARLRERPAGWGRDRLSVMADLTTITANWSLRLVITALALAVTWHFLGIIWEGVLPVLVALLITTILWPVANQLRKWKFPPALASLTTVIGLLALVIGLLMLIAPTAVEQVSQLSDQSVAGLRKLQATIEGPPLNLNDAQLTGYIDQAIEKARNSSGEIASATITGLSAISEITVKAGIILMLVFFFLKDGDKFLPLLRRITGRRGETHVLELLTRVWNTLGGFIRAQAVVAFIDAVFIGLGLVLMDVPLALAIAVVTFLTAFIPVVGAIVAGVLAVLVAFVSQGFTVALLALALVVAVQQLEGNVLSPMLQSKAMNLHPSVVLLSVAVGSNVYGIVGAFLAVPVVATVAETFRYLSEHVDKRVPENLVSEQADADNDKPEILNQLPAGTATE